MTFVLPIEQVQARPEMLNNVHPHYAAKLDDWTGVERFRARSFRELLTKAPLEPESSYDYRRQLTRFVPETPRVRERLLGAVFDSMPLRVGLPPRTKEWTGNVDRLGTDWDSYVEDRLAPDTLDFGSTFVLIDRPRSLETPRNRREEREASLDVVHLTSFSPLEVHNWGVNGDTGELLWVHLVTTEFIDSEAEFSRRDQVHVHRIYDQQNWYIFRTQPERAVVIEGFDETGVPKHRSKVTLVGPMETGPHSTAGFVPGASWTISSTQPMIGETFLNDSMEMDERRLQSESEHAFLLAAQGSQTLKVWSADERATLAVGKNALVNLYPGDVNRQREDCEYFGPDTSSFEPRERFIRESLESSYRHSGLDLRSEVGSQDGPSGALSGVSRRLRHKIGEGRHVKRLRSCFEAAENRTLRLVDAALRGGPPVQDAQWVQYPRAGDDEELPEMMTNMRESRTLVPSETALRLYAKKVAFALIGQVDDEIRTAVESEIDRASAEDLNGMARFQATNPQVLAGAFEEE